MDPALTSLVWDASQHAERELTKAEQKDFQRRLGKARGDAEQRKIALKTIELAHQVAEDRHAKERKWQRGVTIAAAALVTAAAVVVAWAAALGGDAFLPMPADATMSAWQFLLLVMGFGMVGGLLSGTVHLYLDKGPTSGNVWWDARPALTLVKVACGVWTAWVGVVAITSAADSLYNSVPAVLLLALMFGYCQEAVTHYLDQKAGAILTPETAAAAKDNKDRTKLRTARTAIKSRTATTRRTTR